MTYKYQYKLLHYFHDPDDYSVYFSFKATFPLILVTVATYNPINSMHIQGVSITMGVQAQFRAFNKTKFREKEWGDAPTFLQGSYATGMSIVPHR